jgi:hypothetical protein
MVPERVLVVDALPLTPNGKVDRKALPQPAAPSNGASAAAVLLEDDTERVVASVWTEVLDRSVKRDDNFFEIGGHSLAAVKVFRRLSEASGAPLALTDVFRFPTVRTFAGHIDRLSGRSPEGSDADAAPLAGTGTDRGARRRQMLARRRGESP